jgi:hypothetical protein
MLARAQLPTCRLSDLTEEEEEEDDVHEGGDDANEDA